MKNKVKGLVKLYNEMFVGGDVIDVMETFIGDELFISIVEDYLYCIDDKKANNILVSQDRGERAPVLMVYHLRLILKI